MPSVGNQTDSHQPLRTNILQTKQKPNNMLPCFSSSTTYLLGLLHSLLRNNNNKRHSQTPWKTNWKLLFTKWDQIPVPYPFPPPRLFPSPPPSSSSCVQQQKLLKEKEFQQNLTAKPLVSHHSRSRLQQQQKQDTKKDRYQSTEEGDFSCLRFFQSSFSILVIRKIVFLFSYASRLLLRVSVRLRARPQEARERERERAPPHKIRERRRRRDERREERECVCVRVSSEQTLLNLFLFF